MNLPIQVITIVGLVIISTQCQTTNQYSEPICQFLGSGGKFGLYNKFTLNKSNPLIPSVEHFIYNRESRQIWRLDIDWDIALMGQISIKSMEQSQHQWDTNNLFTYGVFGKSSPSSVTEPYTVDFNITRNELVLYFHQFPFLTVKQVSGINIFMRGCSV